MVILSHLAECEAVSDFLDMYEETLYPEELVTQTYVGTQQAMSKPCKTMDGKRRAAWMETQESRNKSAREARGS